MGSSRGISNHHRSQNPELRVEEYNLQVWDLEDYHIGQWAAVRQPRFQRLLLKPKHQEPILIPKESIGEWIDGGDELDTAQDYQSQARRRKGCLARRIAQRPMGLQNHGKKPNWRNPLQTHLWH